MLTILTALAKIYVGLEWASYELGGSCLTIMIRVWDQSSSFVTMLDSQVVAMSNCNNEKKERRRKKEEPNIALK